MCVRAAVIEKEEGDREGGTGWSTVPCTFATAVACKLSLSQTPRRWFRSVLFVVQNTCEQPELEQPLEMY